MTSASSGLAVLIVLLLAPGTGLAQGYLPAGDQVHERLVEISGFTGWQMLDQDLDYSSGAPLLGIRGTVSNSAWWAFEAKVAYSPGNTREIVQGEVTSFSAHPVYNISGVLQTVVITGLESREYVEESSASLFAASGSMLFHLKKGRWRPFFTVGAGVIDEISNREGNPRGPLSDPFLEFGVGLKYLRPSGWGVRLDVTDLFTRKSDAPRRNLRAPIIAAEFATAEIEPADWVNGDTNDLDVSVPYIPFDYRGQRWLNNVGVSVSVSMPFGFAWKDRDGDNVETRFDECRSTAPGVVVDALGCGIDSDEDGVFDGLDQCEGTPLGAFVDLGGCPNDMDSDGVFDGIDVADDTPAGALVDERGQHYDTDGDGMFDGIDICNDTPLGAAINEDGCVEDPVEDAFLRGQAIVVQDVRFEGSSDEIDPLSYHHVNKVARLVERWTGNNERPLRVEIGVHTDGTSAEDANLRLSQRRAENIRLYLLENFFGIGANNLVAKGYGESMPIADGETAQGRNENDRMEILFTAEGDPPEEYDFGASEEEALFGEEDLFVGDGSGESAQPAAGDVTGDPDTTLDDEIPPPPPPIEVPELEDDLDLSDEPEIPE